MLSAMRLAFNWFIQAAGVGGVVRGDLLCSHFSAVLTFGVWRQRVQDTYLRWVSRRHLQRTDVYVGGAGDLLLSGGHALGNAPRLLIFYSGSGSLRRPTVRSIFRVKTARKYIA